MTVSPRAIVALVLIAMTAMPIGPFSVPWASLQTASANDCCGGCGVSYKIVCQTVYEQQPVTTYRLEYETVMEPKQVTSYKPVWETEVRERRYRVAKPVMETSVREEQYKVMKPVTETTYEERSYDRVRYVCETSTREERTVVNRPVWETETRQQQHTVRRAVQDTVMQTRNYTTYEPVTTCKTQYVDQGQYVDQQVSVPGPTRTRLRWLSSHTSVDPSTGLPFYQRAGFHWVPEQAPASVTTQRVYVPNVVAVKVPQTQMVAKQVSQQCPVQVTRYVDEVVTTPVEVKVCKIQQEVQVKQIPVTVKRPITERVTYRVPVQTCKWEEQILVRKVPVTTCKWQYEDKVEQYQVRTCKLVAETSVVQQPRTVAKWVAQQSVCQKPRTVVMRVPIDSCTGNVIAQVAPVTAVQYAPPLTVVGYGSPAQTPAGAIVTPLGETTVSRVEPKDPTPAEPTPAEGEAEGTSVIKNQDPPAGAGERGLPPLPDVIEAPSDDDPTGTPELNGAG